MPQQSIDECVEALCQKGCGAVWHDIAALEAGDSLPEAQGLSAEQKQEVLVQLKSIMSVYQGSCSAQ